MLEITFKEMKTDRTKTYIASQLYADTDTKTTFNLVPVDSHGGDEITLEDVMLESVIIVENSENVYCIVDNSNCEFLGIVANIKDFIDFTQLYYESYELNILPVAVTKDRYILVERLKELYDKYIKA